MKIPIQEKIAELEARIAALEKAAQTHVSMNRSFVTQTQTGVFGKHWDSMWASFEKVMEEAFKK